MPSPSHKRAADFDWKAMLSNPAVIGAGVGGLAGAVLPSGDKKKDGFGRRFRNALLGAGLGGAAGYAAPSLYAKTAPNGLGEAWKKLMGSKEEALFPKPRGSLVDVPGPNPPEVQKALDAAEQNRQSKSETPKVSPPTAKPTQPTQEPQPATEAKPAVSETVPETASPEAPASPKVTPNTQISTFDSLPVKSIFRGSGAMAGVSDLLENRDRVIGGFRQMTAPKGSTPLDILQRGRLSIPEGEKAWRRLYDEQAAFVKNNRGWTDATIQARLDGKTVADPKTDEYLRLIARAEKGENLSFGNQGTRSGGALRFGKAVGRAALYPVAAELLRRLGSAFESRLVE